MRTLSFISNSIREKHDLLLSLASIFAVIGPIVVVCAGFWDAISHLLNEPEFFWSPSHVVVYVGVAITCCAGIIGGILVLKKVVNRMTGIAIKLVIAGAAMQIVAGLGDSISHDLFGIDGLVSWSHQPLELGLVLGSLGGVLILKNIEHTRLRMFIPFSIVTFLFFVTWLGFNLVLIFGHTIQCIPIYNIFSSGCSIL